MPKLKMLDLCQGLRVWIWLDIGNYLIASPRRWSGQNVPTYLVEIVETTEDSIEGSLRELAEHDIADVRIHDFSAKGDYEYGENHNENFTRGVREVEAILNDGLYRYVDVYLFCCQKELSVRDLPHDVRDYFRIDAEWAETADFDDLFGELYSGIYVWPSLPEDENPHYNIRALDEYCKQKGIKAIDLSEEELRQFRTDL